MRSRIKSNWILMRNIFRREIKAHNYVLPSYSLRLPKLISRLEMNQFFLWRAGLRSTLSFFCFNHPLNSQKCQSRSDLTSLWQENRKKHVFHKEINSLKIDYFCFEDFTRVVVVMKQRFVILHVLRKVSIKSDKCWLYSNSNRTHISPCSRTLRYW